MQIGVVIGFTHTMLKRTRKERSVQKRRPYFYPHRLQPVYHSLEENGIIFVQPSDVHDVKGQFQVSEHVDGEKGTPSRGPIFWFYLSYSGVILVAVISLIMEVNGDIYGLFWYPGQRKSF